MQDALKLAQMSGSVGFIHQVDGAPAYWMQGILWTMLADAEATGGRWSVMEQLMPIGAGPPPHRHLWSDETFYILDGRITFLLDGEMRIATKGAFINIPRNTRHAFRVDSPTARILNGYTPASMEAIIAEFGKRTEERTLPPPGPVASADSMPDELRARYGLAWLDEADPLRPGGHL